MVTAIKDYRHSGVYSKPAFQTQFILEFSKTNSYHADALPNLLLLLGMIERDSKIGDVRWAAYMLATVMWETTSLRTLTAPAVNKKGQPLTDRKGRAVVVKKRRWLMTMAPAVEVGHGKGRSYHEPVKIKKLADGSIRVTEQDGDQFTVSPLGRITRLTRSAVMGTRDGGAAVKAYNEEDGDEHAYYGRGYVQLTWWSNYAASGIAIGRGLDLLLDPSLVTKPEVAYALMSQGMRTGKGFANGKSFSSYFSAARTDYAGARRMVNGRDHDTDIAAIAKKFEGILLKAKPAATTHISARRP